MRLHLNIEGSEMVEVMPRCPICGEVAVEMGKGKEGWRWVPGDGRSYHVGGKMRYKCAKGHEWEE